MKTALICIAKDEDNYIDEWIQYHLKLGFSKVFVYQNNWRYQGDKTVYGEAVEWIEFDGQAMQIVAYNDFIDNRRGDFDFAAFFDCDEFLRLPPDLTLGGYLKRFESFYGVAINWRVFGDSNQTFDGKNYLCLQRFTKCSKTLNHHVKTILNMKKCGNLVHFVNPHFIGEAFHNNIVCSSAGDRFVHGPWNDNPADNGVWINHYFCKTLDEYKINKASKGRADINPGDQAYIRSFDDFNQYNLNEIEDRVAADFFSVKPGKIYFTICNYNAQRQKQSLEKSLTALSNIKTSDVVVSMFDNMSKDDSVDVIRKFYDAGVIDHVILSRKNYGKAFAMNRLYEYLCKAYDIDDNDIIVNMDSDIILNYPDFIKNIMSIRSDPTIGYIGYNFFTDDEMTLRAADQNRQSCSGTVKIDDVEYGVLDSEQGLAGGVLAMKNFLFKRFKYMENLGLNNKPAFYGGDDAVLTMCLFRSGYTGLFDKNSPIIHYTAEDSDYQKWKTSVNNSMAYKGFRNSSLPDKGFYD